MVRENYGRVAAAQSACCGGATAGASAPIVTSRSLGYSAEELASVPGEADLGLGCGNPTALAALRPGEVVLDLGAGGGLDALLAAAQVGPQGRVIGVDMTPEMLARARTNAVKAGVADRVEFREGIIEQLPVVSGSVDVILSNCVINLSPDKAAVFDEAFRVLAPGGRLAISDILVTAPLPAAIASLASAYVSCVGGAMVADEYLGLIERAGFVDVRWTRTPALPLLDGMLADPTIASIVQMVGEDTVRRVAETVWSYKIEARKPRETA